MGGVIVKWLFCIFFRIFNGGAKLGLIFISWQLIFKKMQTINIDYQRSMSIFSLRHVTIKSLCQQTLML